MKLAQHMLRDLELQDLRRAFVDAIDARVAEETLGVIFGKIARAAIDLQAGVDDAATHFAGNYLERRGFDPDILARTAPARDVGPHAFGSIVVVLSIRDPLLDQLNIGTGPDHRLPI